MRSPRGVRHDFFAFLAHTQRIAVPNRAQADDVPSVQISDCPEWGVAAVYDSSGLMMCMKCVQKLGLVIIVLFVKKQLLL